ncbi:MULTISPECIES: hypothetical protein [Delftia]|uniref:hypothetical protein n=1 Tax=Delftia TaxID=80865 RepID=UPI001BB08D84|nr:MULTISPECIES: hypothetical protein [Delftia]MBS3722620.1 hypothetical protein [Delftia sp. PE138]
MSLDAVISADLVKTRAEIAALSNALAAARNEIAGLSNQFSNSTALKSIQRIRVQPAAGSGTPYYSDVTITAINPQRTIVLIRQTTPNSGTVRFDCEIINTTTLRCANYYSSSDYNLYSAGVMDIQVVEFK